MKKLILLMLIVLFNSCSPEEQEKINDVLAINPPSWIQGIWDAKDDGANIIGLKFTSNSFIKFQEDGTESNVMLSYIILQGLGFEGDFSVEEFKSSNNYAIKISSISSTDWYRFTKISPTEISWDNAPPLNKANVYLKKI